MVYLQICIELKWDMLISKPSREVFSHLWCAFPASQKYQASVRGWSRIQSVSKVFALVGTHRRGVLSFPSGHRSAMSLPCGWQLKFDQPIDKPAGLDMLPASLVMDSVSPGYGAGANQGRSPEKMEEFFVTQLSRHVAQHRMIVQQQFQKYQSQSMMFSPSGMMNMADRRIWHVNHLFQFKH
jgi:hypothetical protein